MSESYTPASSYLEGHRMFSCEENVLRRMKEILQRYMSGIIQIKDEQHKFHLSLLALLVHAIRWSFSSQKAATDDNLMDIGCPTNVRHITHVTFDKFDGFLGLPFELEVEVPSRVPSASASIFGVSAESMQCSHDRKGNSVPTILLLLQEKLYGKGGLLAEGIFRINSQNSQDREIREQLNKGIVPDGLDIHYLAGLIKTWLRELPKGVLDSLAYEQVMQCSTEEHCIELTKQLPSTEAALLDWTINLMADVVQEEESNKMNAHNIAMVFAPNMTTMDDPLTALMHAVRVMKLLKTLILKALREREEAALDPRPVYTCHESPFDGDFGTDNCSPILLGNDDGGDSLEEDFVEEASAAVESYSYNHKIGSCDNCFRDKLGKICYFDSDDVYATEPIYQSVSIYFICPSSNKACEGLKSRNDGPGHCPRVNHANDRNGARFHEADIADRELSKPICEVRPHFPEFEEEVALAIVSTVDLPSFQFICKDL